MDIYFSPLACSMASRIVAYEADLPVRFQRVDTKAGRTAEGGDYRVINPKGLVPALKTDDGEVLTENCAVLQYLGDQAPKAGLAPGGFARYRLQQWLSFVSTELHKTVFTPLLSPKYDPASKAKAREEAVARFDYLNEALEGRQWLLDDFSVADAYMAAVLNWAQFVSLDLAAWPNVLAYRDRLQARPSVARAMGEELELFRQAA
jgi:glutathione S-transferase